MEGCHDMATDVGDVGWVVPTLHFTVATAPKDAPWHAWPVVATGGMSIGHKGMLLAAKTLAATMVDLYENPEAVDAVTKEFEEKRGDVVFKAYLPEGPPPVPTASPPPATCGTVPAAASPPSSPPSPQFGNSSAA